MLCKHQWCVSKTINVVSKKPKKIMLSPFNMINI